MNHWLAQCFEQYADNIAIVDRSGSYTYQSLLKQIDSYSLQLSKDIKQACVVAISSDYSFHSIALFLATIEMNLIIVPIVSKNEQEIKDKLQVSGASFVLTFKDVKLDIYKLENNHLADNSLCQSLINQHHGGLILFSSGSTAKPKAMLHDLTVLLTNYKDKKNKPLSILIFLLFDHIGGINTLFNTLAMGAKAVIAKKRDAQSIAQLVEQEKVKILPTSPTFLNLFLLDERINQYNLSSIRMISYGTETMPESLLARIKTVFPKAKLLQTFGTSETGIAQVSSRSSTSLDIKINDPNLQYKIIAGELWLKSKTQILGYLNASMESFSQDGWFATGDLIEEKEGGYLKIIGRVKQVINVGGEKVLPTEVESFLLQMDEVKDCLVYAQKNAITGQTVVADIVTNSVTSHKVLKMKLIKACLAKMPRYKVPTKFNFVDHVQINSRFKKVRNLASS